MNARLSEAQLYPVSAPADPRPSHVPPQIGSLNNASDRRIKADDYGWPVPWHFEMGTLTAHNHGFRVLPSMGEITAAPKMIPRMVHKNRYPPRSSPDSNLLK